MKLYVAGGCGEQGRNCFYVEGSSLRFLVDCGLMAGEEGGGYPRLTQEQIDSLDCVFLTHSHSDHAGALPWLGMHGYKGPIVASRDTALQFPRILSQTVFLEALCPPGGGRFKGLNIRWGRSGHCAGSVWYRFSGRGKTILFSGDYNEEALVYACDGLRDNFADLAVLDCAYGRDDTSFRDACKALVEKTGSLLDERGLLLFPVPKYGRGLELLRLFSDAGLKTGFFGDRLFLKNMAEMAAKPFWYRESAGNSCRAEAYDGQKNGIVFVSDPQLHSAASRGLAEDVAARGGRAVLTGAAERGSFCERLAERGLTESLRYPVHLNWTQFSAIAARNSFGQTVPYHTGEISPPTPIEF